MKIAFHRLPQSQIKIALTKSMGASLPPSPIQREFSFRSVLTSFPEILLVEWTLNNVGMPLCLKIILSVVLHNIYLYEVD